MSDQNQNDDALKQELADQGIVLDGEAQVIVDPAIEATEAEAQVVTEEDEVVADTAPTETVDLDAATE